MEELNIKKIQDHVFQNRYKKNNNNEKNENILNLKQTTFHVVQKKCYHRDEQHTHVEMTTSSKWLYKKKKKKFQQILATEKEAVHCQAKSTTLFPLS